MRGGKWQEEPVEVVGLENAKLPFKSLIAKIKTTLTGDATLKQRRRDLFSFSPLAKIDVRLGLALGGNTY